MTTGKELRVRGRQLVAILVVSTLVFTSFVHWSQPEAVDVPAKAPSIQFATGKSGAFPSISTLMSIKGTTFIENKGQLGNPAILFYAQGDPLSVGFTRQGLVLTLLEPQKGDGRTANGDATSRRSIAFTLGFEGSSDVGPEGAIVLSQTTNVFKGNDPSKWVRGARSYAELAYHGLYPGVDLRFYFKQGMLKYDLVVQPWADAGRIVLHYEGVTSLGLDAQTGDLLIGTALGTVRDMRPVVYQSVLSEDDGQPSDYILLAGDRVGFGLPKTGSCGAPITIDPGLEFATYLGGRRYEWGRCIALDDDGNIIIIGDTYSLDFPTTPGAYAETGCATVLGCDIFVSKFDPTGSRLLFSTYVGGDDIDMGREVQVAHNGSIYCVGYTGSYWDFPITSTIVDDDGQPVTRNGADAPLFILSADGTDLQYSAIVCEGGGYNLNLCRDGGLVVVGTTWGNEFPVTKNAYSTPRPSTRTDWDLFFAKVNRSLCRLDFAGLIGGTKNEGLFVGDVGEFRLDSEIDEQGNIILFAGTDSTDLPITDGAYKSTKDNASGTDSDNIIAKVDPTGSHLLHSTYFGGKGADVANDVLVAQNGSIYIAGWTYSTNLPTTPDALVRDYGGINSGYMAMFDPDLTRLVYCTYFAYEDATETSVQVMAFGPDNRTLYLFLGTTTSKMQTTHGAFDDTFRGARDIFLLGLNVTNYDIVYGTFFGGSGDDGGEARGVKEMMVDSEGNLLALGRTASSDMPTTRGCYDPTYNDMSGESDIIVFKLDPRPCTAPLTPTNITARPEDGRVNLTWDPPDGRGQRFLQHYLYWGTSPTDISNRITVSKSDWTTVHYGLTNGMEYYYQLSAYNKMGESPRTEVVRARPLGVPSCPQGFRVVNENGSIHMNWSAPSYIGAELLGYHLLKETLGIGTEQLDFGPEATAYDDYQVQAGVQYTYRIRGYNSLWNGTWTDPPQEVVPQTVPSAPLGLNATGKDRSVELTWKAPQSDGAAPIVSYRIYMGPSKASMQFLDTVPRSKLGYVATGLENGVVYCFYVTAFNAIGDGPRSEVVEGMPRGPPREPQQLVVTPGDGRVTLTWTAPANDGGSAITGYKVFGGTDPAGLRRLITTGGAETTYVDTGLTNGVTYHYQVLAMNELGDGQRTALVSVKPGGVPGAVQNLVIVEGFGWLKLMWQPPADTGGGLQGIRVYRGEGPTAFDLIKELNPEVTSYKDTNVTAGRVYHYKVIAVSAGGEGLYDQPISGVPFGLPGAPEQVAATAGDGQVRLKWNSPSVDGGRPVTGYTVFRSEPGVPLRVLAELGNVLSYMDIDVVNGRAYGYVVRAVNEAGMGEASGAVEATPAKQVGVPGAVQSPRAELKGGQVVLTWGPPASDGGSPVTGYVILRGAGPGNLTALAEVGAVLSYTDTAVERGRTYYYGVVAKNAAGQGERTGSALEANVPEKKTSRAPGLVFTTAATTLGLAWAIQRRNGRRRS